MAIYALGDREPTIDPTAWVHPDAVVIGDVRLGPESSIWPGAVLRGDYGFIEIGARSSIQDGSVLHTTEEFPTVIGADCVVGHLVHAEGCQVSHGCLIGSGSILLNRSSVGTGSVVGAAALVGEDMEVPPGHLAIGVPAKVRPLPDPAAMAGWVRMAVRMYVENSARYAKDLRRLD